MSKRKSTLSEKDAIHINSITSMEFKETVQIKENVLSVRKKIVDEFTKEGYEKGTNLDFEFTQSECVSIFRACTSILEKNDGSIDLLVWAKTASKKLGFEKQLRDRFDLDKDVELPKDFKFDDEYEIGKELEEVV